MQCIKCNRTIKDNASFCPMCGTAQVKSNPPYNTPYNPGYSSPVYNQPVSNVGPSVKWNWKNNKFSGLNHFGSVVLCLLILITCIVGALSYSINQAYSEDILKDAFHKVNLASIEIGDMVGAESSDITLVDVIYYNVLGENDARYLGVDRDDIKNFLESREVENFYSEELSSYMNYILNNEGSGITTEDIVDFVQDNPDLFREYFHFYPSSEVINHMQDWLDTELDKDGAISAFGDYSQEYFESLNLDKELAMIQKFTSITLRIAAAALIVLLVALLILIDRKRSYIAFIYLSATNALLAASFYILYCSNGKIASLIEEYTKLDRHVLKDFLSILLRSVKNCSFVFLIFCGAFALIALLIGLLVPVFKNKARN